MKLAPAVLLIPLFITLAACATDDEVCSGGRCVAQVVCGPGTHAEVGVCVADEVEPPCERGTHEQDGACVPDVECGPGTYALNGRCIPETVAPTCPAGTHDANGECVPDVVCGPLTHAEGGVCVPDIDCGDEQHDLAGACVPDFGYEIRVVTSTVEADGVSKIPVLVIGTAPDGTPARDRVVLTVSQGGGALLTREVTLTPVGNTIYFVPCNAISDRTCAGATTLTLALASAPTLTLATAEIELVPPTGVGSTAPCEIAPNVLFFDGNDYIFTGTQTVTQGLFDDDPRNDNWVTFRVEPSDDRQGGWWHLDFSTVRLGRPLAPGVYNNAQRASFAQADRPGLDVGGDGRGCNQISGRFQIHDYVLENGEVQRALITFEQHCERGARVLRGCLGYDRALRQ